MYLSLISIPLLGSIISGFFGRKLGQSGSELATIVCVLLSTIFSIFTFLEVGFNSSPVSIKYFSWIQSEALDVSWSFNFDSLTVSMLIPVLIVSVLVHVYSVGYMSHDPHVQRFFSYLSLFTFMMIILVTANNFLLMFVGWEGVGICSYLLVNFWFTRIAANQSSISALLTNRVGDCFLTIGMFVMLFAFGNLDYYTIFSLSPYMNSTTITIIGVCILTGAMAKSSQVGLHVWLPMAMEGPTPVSALIHAATMVTAGVYLLMRTSPIIEYSSLVLVLCLWVGGITTIFSSLVGLFQQDIKKVIAYSTMSQLGMMVIAIGLSSYTIALFHLINHAFYKALLFLGAGAVIHAVGDNQDFRKYGGLRPFLPLTYSVMLIASLSLVAFPFMTGFYSKDFILESTFGQHNYSSIVIYCIATIGAMFTTLYSVKVLYLTFLAKPTGPLHNYINAHEGDIFMNLPLIILAFFSVFFGFVTKDMFIGLGSGFFSDNGIFIHPSHEIMLDTEFGVPVLFKLLPLVFTVFLSTLSIIILEIYPNLIILAIFTAIGHSVYSFFNQRFYIELFYNNFITEPVLKVGGQTTKVLDKGAIEVLGPYGLQVGLIDLSNDMESLSKGALAAYSLLILAGLISYIILPLIPTILWFMILLAMFSRFTHEEHKPSYTNNLHLVRSGLIPSNSNRWFIKFKNKFLEKHKSVKNFFLKLVAISLIAILVKLFLSFLFDDSNIISFVFINGTAVSAAFTARSCYDIITDLYFEEVTLNSDNEFSKKFKKLAYIGNANPETPFGVEDNKPVFIPEERPELSGTIHNAMDNNQEPENPNDNIPVGTKRPASEELTPGPNKSPKLDDNAPETPDEDPEESDSSSKGGFSITFDESEDNNEPLRKDKGKARAEEDTSKFAPGFIEWQEKEDYRIKGSTKTSDNKDAEDTKTSDDKDAEDKEPPVTQNRQSGTRAPIAIGHTLGITEPQIRRTGSPLASDVQSFSTAQGPSGNTESSSGVQGPSSNTESPSRPIRPISEQRCQDGTERLGKYKPGVDPVHFNTIKQFMRQAPVYLQETAYTSRTSSEFVPVYPVSDYLDSRITEYIGGNSHNGNLFGAELRVHNMWGGTARIIQTFEEDKLVTKMVEITVIPEGNAEIAFNLGGKGTNKNVSQPLSLLLFHVKQHGVYTLSEENTSPDILAFIHAYQISRNQIVTEEVTITNRLINGLYSA